MGTVQFIAVLAVGLAVFAISSFQCIKKKNSEKNRWWWGIIAAALIFLFDILCMILPPAPMIGPGGESTCYGQFITLSCDLSLPGCEIYYSTDGFTDPKNIDSEAVHLYDPTESPVELYMGRNCSVTVMARSRLWKYFWCNGWKEKTYTWQNVEEITFKTEIISIPVGSQIALSPEVLPSTASDKTLHWASSAPAVVQVDENGLLTACSVGEALITATDHTGDVSASCHIKAVQADQNQPFIPVSALHISQNELILSAGEAASLSATVEPENATKKIVSWTSSDPSIVSVGIYNGHVDAYRVGKASITAQCGDQEVSIPVTVTREERNEPTPPPTPTPTPTPPPFIPVQSITILGAEDLSPGESIGLQASLYPDNATDQTVYWTSSDPSVIQISNDGVAVGCGGSGGFSTLTAHAGNVTSSVQLYAYPSLSPSMVSFMNLDPGESMPLNLSWGHSKTPPSVTIWSNNDMVAQVSGQYIYGNSPGQCWIYATVDDVLLSCNVFVNDYPLPSLSDLWFSSYPENMCVGNDFYLEVGWSPAESPTDFDWWSDDPDVIYVSDSGHIIALQPGWATVYVEDWESGLTDSISIHVLPLPDFSPVEPDFPKDDPYSSVATSFWLTDAPDGLSVGWEWDLDFDWYPHNVVVSPTWWSDVPDIIDVDRWGHIWALNPGVATVFAEDRYSGLSASATIYVFEDSSF